MLHHMQALQEGFIIKWQWISKTYPKSWKQKKCSLYKIQVEIRQFFLKFGDFLPKKGYI
jgi:hypothetical protein